MTAPTDPPLAGGDNTPSGPLPDPHDTRTQQVLDSVARRVVRWLWKRAGLRKLDRL